MELESKVMYEDDSYGAVSERVYVADEVDEHIVELVSEKDEIIAALKKRNQCLLDKVLRRDHALALLRADYSMWLVHATDYTDQGNTKLWLDANKYWRAMSKRTSYKPTK